MTPQTPITGDRCQCLVIQGGEKQKSYVRFVDDVVFHFPDANPKRLQGRRRPGLIVLNLGASPEDTHVLDLLYPEPVKRPTAIKVVSVEPDAWRNGRDVVAGIVGILLFVVCTGVMNAMLSVSL